MPGWEKLNPAAMKEQLTIIWPWRFDSEEWRVHRQVGSRWRERLFAAARNLSRNGTHDLTFNHRIHNSPAGEGSARWDC
jgi:hypothetical protein